MRYPTNNPQGQGSTPEAASGVRELPETVTFLRRRDYKYIRELGRGACGITILLHDEIIDEMFVCKKYSPFYEEDRKDLFSSFLSEIKLLHLVSHPNIVRVFNYYIYE